MAACGLKVTGTEAIGTVVKRTAVGTSEPRHDSIKTVCQRTPLPPQDEKRRRHDLPSL